MPSDAYAALVFLQTQPFIDPARVSLGGWAPIIGTDDEARADAYERVRIFLRALH